MDYQKQATEFLEKTNAKIFIEKDANQSAPTWAGEKEKHGYKYQITIVRGTQKAEFPFWDSIANREAIEHGKPKAKHMPTAYDVLACITKYDPEDFENFCDMFGYDTDSRKANDIYLAVQKEYHQVTLRLFGDVLYELQEIN